jgi:DNA-binding beta-propeller fold protein YncE
VRRVVIALSGFLLMGSAISGFQPAGAAPPTVTTVTASGSVGRLDGPGGIALDASGDLFIADTDHCRITLVPNRSGTLYGLSVRARHAYTLAGGSCRTKAGIGFPIGVAVDHAGNVYIADATGQRVLVVRPGGNHGPRPPATVAGTGSGDDGGGGGLAVQSRLDEPSGLAVDAGGDLFIADTGDCRLQMVPAANGVHFGQTMEAAHLYTVAGTGVCGSSGRGGPADGAQLDSPVAVAVDAGGDLFVSDQGDDEVLEVPAGGGTHYGLPLDAGDLGVIVGTGGNGPYLVDGLSATGETAELNDPEGLAVDATGTLFVADGSMHAIRVVPSSTSVVFGRTVDAGSIYTVAGALTVENASGGGNGTRWILTHMDVPVGLALSGSGQLYFSDRGRNQVRVIR